MKRKKKKKKVQVEIFIEVARALSTEICQASAFESRLKVNNVK